MAGHSKWANIKHRKAAVDKKRGKIWSKISRAIMAAARTGGGDPASNLSLRYAIDEARAANMPKDTIQRAVDKGSGAGGGENFEEITYEGYGPGGVAIFVEALTDNRTRTAGDVRLIFSKKGGNIGNPGSVAFMFQSKGRIFVEAGKTSEDAIMSAALEAGAEDVQEPEGEDGVWTILTEPTAFLAVKEAIAAAGIEIAEAELTKIPDNTAAVSGESARQLLALVELLEDNDDVQKVHHNAEISEDDLAAYGG
jgi:YebC/PmpR family DNA-binding regulatory protein